MSLKPLVLPKVPVDKYTLDFWLLYLGTSTHIDEVRYRYYKHILWEDFAITDGDSFSRDSHGAPLTDQWMIFERKVGQERFYPIGRIVGWEALSTFVDNRRDLYATRKECVDAAKLEFNSRIKKAEATVRELKKAVRQLK